MVFDCYGGEGEVHFRLRFGNPCFPFNLAGGEPACGGEAGEVLIIAPVYSLAWLQR